MACEGFVMAKNARHEVMLIPTGRKGTFLYHFEMIDWRSTVVVGVVVLAQQMECRK